MRDTALALVRATLFFGTMAVVMVLVVQPGRFHGDKTMASAPVGLDLMETGSINDGRATPVRIENRRSPAPCLEYPDGTQRGAC